MFISVIYRSTVSTTSAKGSPAPASWAILAAMRVSPEEAEQELNTWIFRSGCSSRNSRDACQALLWEPESRADRVTT